MGKSFTSLLQFYGCIIRILIEKRKLPFSLFLELFSHILLISAILLGFLFSKDQYYQPEIRSHGNISIPPDFATQNATTNEIYNSIKEVISGPIMIPDLNQYLFIGKHLKGKIDDHKRIIFKTSLGRSIKNLVYPGTLILIPKNNLTLDYRDYLLKNYNEMQNITFQFYDSYDEIKANNTKIDRILRSNIFAIIKLNGINNSRIDYEIRQEYDATPLTSSFITSPSNSFELSYQKYILSGFLSLQNSINDFAANYTNYHNNVILKSNNKNNNFIYRNLEGDQYYDYIYESEDDDVNNDNEEINDYYFENFYAEKNEPYDRKDNMLSNNDDEFINQNTVCQKSLPNPFFVPYPNFEYNSNNFFVNLGFIIIITIIMSSLYPVSRMAKSLVQEKETSIKELMFIMGLRVDVYYYGWIFVEVLVFLWISISSTLLCSFIFTFSNNYLIFLLFFLFSLSQISLIFLISSCFSNSSLVGVLAPCIIFMLSLPRFMFISTSSSSLVSSKIICSFLSPTAFALGLDLIIGKEYERSGLQVKNLEDLGYNLKACYVMLIIDCILYSFIALFVNCKDYYTIDYFKKYWTSLFTKERNLDEESSQDDDSDNNKVIIQDLKKKFNKIYVVDGLNFSLKKGEISCLLGHNGAGKSTTISILTGLMSKSSGSISIFNYDLCKDLEEIRKITGLCPQNNVFFPTLSVKEHLYFFGRIKGLSGKKLNEKVMDLLQDTNLVEKMNTDAKSLSGGQKRRLCLAMALIGDPKFVLLDEPTSGMDPYSRRFTWELIRKNKKGRVILLTTHFLDEADSLSDLILVMSNGKLMTSGSSLSLKTKHNKGYSLSLTKFKEGANIEELKFHICNIIEGAKLKSVIGKEVIFFIPSDNSNKFSELFKILEEDSARIGYNSLSLSTTTLEQVFLSLAEDSKKIVNNKNDMDNLSNICMTRHSFIQEADGILVDEYSIENRVNDKELYELEKGNLSISNETNSEGNQITKNFEISNLPEENIKNIIYAQKIKNKIITSLKNYFHKFLSSTFYLLLSKRFKLTIRDLKSLIFYTVTPSLVIVLILTLLVLDLRESQKSLLLGSSSIYHYNLKYMKEIDSNNKKPKFIVGGELAKNNFLTHNLLKDYNELEFFPNSLNSSILSEELLNPENYKVSRYGGLIVNDSIPFNVTIDWNWMKNNTETVSSALQYFPLGRNKNSNSLQNNQEISPIRSNSIVYQISSKTMWNTSIFSDSMENSKRNLRNLQLNSGLVSNSTTNSPSDAYNIPPVKVTNNNSSIESIEFDSITFNKTSGTFNIHDVTIKEKNSTEPRQVDSKELTKEQLSYLFPNGKVTYNLNIPSEYTIMHNASLYHSIAFYYNEFYRTFFDHCLDSIEDVPNENDNYKNNYHRFSTDSSYNVQTFPLPEGKESSIDSQMVISVLTSVFLLIPFCFIPSSFSSNIVIERTKMIKQQQYLSGVNCLLYYVSNFFFDSCLYFIQVFVLLFTLIMIKNYSSNRTLYMFVGSNERVFTLLLLFISYGTASILLTYLLSYKFNDASNSVISITTLNIISGFGFIILYYILLMLSGETSSLKFEKVKDSPSELFLFLFINYIVYLFRLFPPFNLGEGLITLCTSYYKETLWNKKIDYWSWDICIRNIVLLILLSIIFFYLLIRYDLGISEIEKDKIGRKYIEKQDNEVVIEDESSVVKEKLLASSYSHFLQTKKINKDFNREIDEIKNKESLPTLIVNNLHKVYISSSSRCVRSFNHALCGLSLVCKQGDRLGLLGVNGAGKSTTLNLLTGEIYSTKGEIFIEGVEINKRKNIQSIFEVFKSKKVIEEENEEKNKETKNLIGYCPQIDPIFDLMTAYEILWFYGKIKGIQEEKLKKKINYLLDEIEKSSYTNLSPLSSPSNSTPASPLPPIYPNPPSSSSSYNNFYHNYAKNYSGGQKRKLSLAIALLSDPQVVLLDEPTSGVDLETKRSIWKVIERLTKGKTLILISHSMEEVEALCKRVCLLNQGKMLEIGALNELKKKYYGEKMVIEGHCSSLYLSKRMIKKRIYLNNIEEDYDELEEAKNCEEAIQYIIKKLEKEINKNFINQAQNENKEDLQENREIQIYNQKIKMTKQLLEKMKSEKDDSISSEDYNKNILLNEKKLKKYERKLDVLIMKALVNEEEKSRSEIDLENDSPFKLKVVLREFHGSSFSIEVDNRASLSLIFKELEKLKDQKVIDDYLVSENSLEKIFLELVENRLTKQKELESNRIEHLDKIKKN